MSAAAAAALVLVGLATMSKGNGSERGDETEDETKNQTTVIYSINTVFLAIEPSHLKLPLMQSDQRFFTPALLSFLASVSPANEYRCEYQQYQRSQACLTTLKSGSRVELMQFMCPGLQLFPHQARLIVLVSRRKAQGIDVEKE